MVVFRIYRAWSAANPIFTRLCEGRFNITRREWRILATSVAHGRLGSAALAEAAMLDSVRTSRTITALCEKGWLQRQRDTQDARNIYVEASPAGLELYRRIMPIIVELNEQVAQDLSAEERRVLDAALDKIMRRSQSLLQAEVIKDRPHRGQGGTRRPQGC
jgi:DNA-binding MarR family transcriptional regulator